MGLTSAEFIMVLFLVALGTGTVTVLRWPRHASHGFRPVAARVGLLVATQLTMILALGTFVNAHFGFYSDWADLLGTNRSLAVMVPGPAQAGAAGAKPPAALANVNMGVRKDHRESVASGEVEEFRFRGESTGLEGYAYVMLPVEYSRPEYAGRRFPVVVMLTGYPGDAHALITSMHFPSLVHEGEISGRVQPTVYVLMRPTLVPPRDTECTDVPAGPQTESFFAQDLPQALAANYRVADDRAGWGIMGDSTGGYCAAKIAMRHFDRFTAAASLAGYFRALRDLTTGDLYGGSHAVRNDNDLLWRAQHLPAPPISLLVASTRVGEQSYPEARRFLALARPPMRVDSLLLSSGGHNFATFRRMLPATLGWMSARLKPE